MKEQDKELIGSRIRLRHLQIQDAEFILSLVNTPGWLEFIGNRDVHTLEDAKLYLLTGPLASYYHHGFGLYCVENKDSGAAMGICGLIRREGLQYPDLGFSFLPVYTGQGFAKEAAGLVLDHWFKKEGLEIIDAITLPVNLRAINLLQKLGFYYQQQIRLSGDQPVLSLYRLTQ
jgi:RimJ/RimL family protein N-acetyltransferase